MLGADCCCFCSASIDVGPAGCHWMNYVTASVGFECGCAGGKKKTTVFTLPSWQLVSSAFTCKSSMRTRATQLRASQWRDDRWTAACDRLFQRKGRVPHCSLIAPSNVDARTQPFVKFAEWDFISGWSFHGSVQGWTYETFSTLSVAKANAKGHIYRLQRTTKETKYT